MDFIYELFGTDKDSFFQGLMDLFDKVWTVILPFILSAKMEEILGGTQK